MKYCYLLLLICLLSFSAYGQGLIDEVSPVATEIQSKNEFDLSVIQVFPQDFPKVSVVFQAKNENGEPLWLLNKEEFIVTENNFVCEVLDVRNISENRPLNLALVFDHSGSMVENPDHMTDASLSYQQLYFDNQLPKGYVMSIDYAKEAVLNFFQVENQANDSMFFVGFSGTVDKIKPLTNDFDRFEYTVRNVTPGGYTAFYDAVYSAVDSLSNHHSQSAVIALTDGGDNSSVHTYKELIKFANEKEVPIYIIGLGDVNSYILKQISSKTNGFYYYTKDPKKLTEIYENIKKQLRSIYELDYLSDEDNPTYSSREIKFFFANDTLSFNSNNYEFELSEEVVAHLEARKEELRIQQEELKRQEELKENIMIGGSIAGILLLGIGGYLIVRRKKMHSGPKIINVFPNPFEGQTTITCALSTGEGGTLSISNMTGVVVREVPVMPNSLELNIDLSELASGTYLFSVKTANGSSNLVKAIKK